MRSHRRAAIDVGARGIAHRSGEAMSVRASAARRSADRYPSRACHTVSATLAERSCADACIVSVSWREAACPSRSLLELSVAPGPPKTLAESDLADLAGGLTMAPRREATTRCT